MATITHFFKTYFPDTQGGLEEAIRQIGKCATKAGYHVRVVTVSPSPQHIELDGIECISFKRDWGVSSMPVSYDLIREYSRLVDETDIVQLHYPYPFTELLTVFNRKKKPIVITYHAGIEDRPLLTTCYSPFERRLFKKADVIVPTSVNLMMTTKRLDKFRDKCRDINLWLDEERFEKLGDVSDDFKAQVDGFGDYALFIGVLRFYKGLDYLLDAAKNVNRKIIVVGKGPEREHLEKRIREEGISNIVLMGYVPDEGVAYLLKNCAMLVLPSQSRGECFGQVLLEAEYFHKPMISTELRTGTSVVNQDGVTGYVVPKANAQALAERMNELFENKEKRLEMGENAYSRYLNNYTEEIQGPKYIKLYEELLRNK